MPQIEILKKQKTATGKEERISCWIYCKYEIFFPHRFLFLLIDQISEMELREKIVGIKNVTPIYSRINE